MRPNLKAAKAISRENMLCDFSILRDATIAPQWLPLQMAIIFVTFVTILHDGFSVLLCVCGKKERSKDV